MINSENSLNKKNLFLSLISIYGIGKYRIKYICNKCNVKLYVNLKYLNFIDLLCINKEINNFLIKDDLKKKINYDIKNLISINSYRGTRHLKNLPARGQRTRRNSKTNKKKNIKRINFDNKNIIKNKNNGKNYKKK